MLCAVFSMYIQFMTSEEPVHDNFRKDLRYVIALTGTCVISGVHSLSVFKYFSVDVCTKRR